MGTVLKVLLFTICFFVLASAQFVFNVNLVRVSFDAFSRYIPLTEYLVASRIDLWCQGGSYPPPDNCAYPPSFLKANSGCTV